MGRDEANDSEPPTTFPAVHAYQSRLPASVTSRYLCSSVAAACFAGACTLAVLVIACACFCVLCRRGVPGAAAAVPGAAEFGGRLWRAGGNVQAGDAHGAADLEAQPVLQQRGAAGHPGARDVQRHHRAGVQVHERRGDVQGRPAGGGGEAQDHAAHLRHLQSHYFDYKARSTTETPTTPGASRTARSSRASTASWSAATTSWTSRRPSCSSPSWSASRSAAARARR